MHMHFKETHFNI